MIQADSFANNLEWGIIVNLVLYLGGHSNNTVRDTFLGTFLTPPPLSHVIFFQKEQLLYDLYSLNCMLWKKVFYTALSFSQT